MKKIKILLGILILTLASLSLIGEDLLKFLLSGQSGTYNVFLVRHNYLVVLGIASIALVFNLFLEKNRLNKYFLGGLLVLLILSLRTFAVVKNPNNTVLVSGFSFFPISKCVMNEVDDCDVKFDFFLENKVTEAISLSSP